MTGFVSKFINVRQCSTNGCKRYSSVKFKAQALCYFICPWSPKLTPGGAHCSCAISGKSGSLANALVG